MAKISTYSTVTPADGDLVLISDVNDSNNTKNVTVSALRAALSAYTEVYSSGGDVTVISQAGAWYPLNITAAVQGATNDNSLSLAVNGEVSNQGANRTFFVSYAVAGISQINNSLMFRLYKNGNAILYSESDTVCGNLDKSTTTGNFAIITLNTGDFVRLYCSNASTAQDIELEHFNLVLRQV